MNKNLKKLNKILLSDTVKDDFYAYYNTDSQFKNWLLSVLPEIEDCRLQKQNNIWHIYNVLDHILVSASAINKLTTQLSGDEKRLLVYVMLLHDIGKPKAHKTKINKEGVEVDIFPNHQIISEKIASRVAEQFGFNKEESVIIKKLVLDHDYFMHMMREDGFDINNLSYIAKEKICELNDYGDGYKLNQMLTLIGLSDNLAQNPLLTKPSIELIEKYRNISCDISISELL